MARFVTFFSYTPEGWARLLDNPSDRSGPVGATIAELVSENQHGDPRYLEEARKALADLRKIWGVDAPARMSIEASPFASMSDEALELELKRHLRL